MVKVSVLVAAYNIERYIGKCIDSVLSQGFKDIEVIVVDDASGDSTPSICRSYALRDDRVKLIMKSVNEGVSKGRFDALALAQGEYILFVDGDDWVESGLIERVYTAAKEQSADVVEFGSYRVLDKWGIIKSKRVGLSERMITNPELFDEYYISFFGKNILNVSLWSHLFKADALKRANLSPAKHFLGEDLLLMLGLFPHIESYLIVDYVGYNYRMGGGTSRFNPNLMISFKELFVLKQSLIQKYNYQKAHRYTCIELANCLKTHIMQMMRNDMTKQEILGYLETEIKDPIYETVVGVDCELEFYVALREGDISWMYDIAYTIHRKGRNLRALRSWLFRLVGA